MAEQHCQYFVKRKNRFCRMTVKKGNEFCGEHLPQRDQSNIEDDKNVNPDKKRVACPLDPTHTCYESKLSKHLKVCNTRRKNDTQPPYLVTGINLEDAAVIPKHQPLSSVEPSILDKVLKKIDTAYRELPTFPEVILSHPVMASELENPAYGKSVRKHLLQNASLIAHLENAGLVEEGTCFVEFGAGRGELTFWLAQMIKEQKGSSLLLIDRSSHRHKRDNRLKNLDGFLHDVMRIHGDIADLRLSAVEEIRKFDRKVGIAKHLCGPATDLTISCLVKSMYDEPSVNVSGLVIAFCCHHQCVYSSYVGKEYLRKCGFTPDEFEVLRRIASWATCGTGKSRSAIGVMDGAKGEGVDGEALQRRESIGRKAKALLNWGRLEYLDDAGFQSNLLYYTATDVSLENMCIVATRNTRRP